MFCAVPKCTLDYKKCNGIDFQYFSKDRTMARKWCMVINRPELMDIPRKELEKLYICGKHFEVSQLNKRTKKIKCREIPMFHIESFDINDTKTEPSDTFHDVVIKTEPQNTVVIKTEPQDTVHNPIVLQTYNINATGCSELPKEGEWYILPEPDIKTDPELVTPMDQSSAEADTNLYCYDVFEYFDNNFIEDVNQPMDLSMPRFLNNSILEPETSINIDHDTHEISKNNYKGIKCI